MLTDAPPRKANRAQFLESDRMKTLDLPKDGRLPSITKSIESAMKGGKGRTFVFGDYDPETSVIRVWMRTAVRKEVTSFGTFLSTLCHEFCHHLDCNASHFSPPPKFSFL
jgi:hypothetical protein